MKIECFFAYIIQATFQVVLESFSPSPTSFITSLQAYGQVCYFAWVTKYFNEYLDISIERIIISIIAS